MMGASEDEMIPSQVVADDNLSSDACPMIPISKASHLHHRSVDGIDTIMSTPVGFAKHLTRERRFIPSPRPTNCRTGAFST